VRKLGSFRRGSAESGLGREGGGGRRASTGLENVRLEREGEGDGDGDGERGGVGSDELQRKASVMMERGSLVGYESDSE
jgi:hypothetical protein